MPERYESTVSPRVRVQPATHAGSASLLAPEFSPEAKCLIRPATSADIPAITRLYASFVESSTATSEMTPPPESEMRTRWRSCLDRNLPYLVAELEGYTAGFCYASQFRPREGYRETLEDSIYVRPDCAGHGVGHLLLSTLIAHCTRRGARSLVACILGHNPASLALHRSLGFQQAGLLPQAAFKFGQHLHLLLMQRML